MTDLITQAIECLRKNGEPLLADAMELARELGADLQALLGDGEPQDPRP